MTAFLEMAVNYSGRYKEKLAKLSEPLGLTFGINYFFYLYITSRHECCFVGTNADLIQDYFDQQMHHYNPFFKHPENINTGVYLYDSVKYKTFQRSMHYLEERYNTKHSCLLTRKDTHGVHIYGFSVPAYRQDHDCLLINRSAAFKTVHKVF